MDIVSILSQIDFATYWGVFIFGLAISATAMSTGIDGAVFWAPVLLLIYKVDPAVAIACAIAIEVFGFGSGVYGYAKNKKILYKQACFFLIFAIPLGILGAYVSKIVSANLLISLIGLSCIILMVINWRRAKFTMHEKDSKKLELKNKGVGGLVNGIGGFFTGIIGIGIGEANHYYLLIKNRYPIAYASGTSVFTIAVTAIVCTVFNMIYFKASTNVFNWTQIISILAFAIPSVIIGARFGVVLAHNIKRKSFNYFLVSVFAFMAVISFYRVYVSVGSEQMLASLLH